MVVCASCAEKWYICTFCKAASAAWAGLPGSSDDECCRDYLYSCQLCRSWQETWWQIYPDKRPDPAARFEE